MADDASTSHTVNREAFQAGRKLARDDKKFTTPSQTGIPFREKV
jgi:hypothetical protein